MFTLLYSKGTKERCIKLLTDSSASKLKKLARTCANEAGTLKYSSLSVLFLSACYNYYLEISFFPSLT